MFNKCVRNNSKKNWTKLRINPTNWMKLHVIIFCALKLLARNIWKQCPTTSDVSEILLDSLLPRNAYSNGVHKKLQCRRKPRSQWVEVRNSRNKEAGRSYLCWLSAETAALANMSILSDRWDKRWYMTSHVRWFWANRPLPENQSTGRFRTFFVHCWNQRVE